MTALLAQLRGVGVRYGRRDPVTALEGVDLDIHAGERLALIGESGSGKSTLALALAGLLPDDAARSGIISWPGLDGPMRPGRDVGFIFQDPGMSLDPVLSIGEQVAEAVRVRPGISWRQAYDIAESLLARVQLPQPERLLAAYPHQLSGGQRQRVAIAAAIAGRPRLLIADEATSALDMIVQAEIVALLDALVAEDGMSLLLITHDMALAATVAQRMAVFRHARLVEQGPTQAVLSAPTSAYTQSLISAHIGLDAPMLVGER